MTTPDSAVAAASSDQSVLRWPALAVALFVATASAHTTMTEYFVTPFARTAFLVGIAIAAVGWVLILRHEHEYLRNARAALPYAELRRLPTPMAGRLCCSLLFRWSVVFCITVASVEYALTIVDLNPGTGAVGGFIALALVAAALGVRRGTLGPRRQLVEMPDVAPVRNIALSHPVRTFGSIVFVWAVFLFGLLVLATGVLKLLN
jgi:hypothetical protein